MAIKRTVSSAIKMQTVYLTVKLMAPNKATAVAALLVALTNTITRTEVGS